MKKRGSKHVVVDDVDVDEQAVMGGGSQTSSLGVGVGGRVQSEIGVMMQALMRRKQVELDAAQTQVVATARNKLERARMGLKVEESVGLVTAMKRELEMLKKEVEAIIEEEERDVREVETFRVRFEKELNEVIKSTASTSAAGDELERDAEVKLKKARHQLTTIEKQHQDRHREQDPFITVSIQSLEEIVDVAVVAIRTIKHL